MSDELTDIATDPRYRDLVRRRTRFAWGLSASVVGLYTIFILVLALDRSLFARSISGGAMSWGVPIGIVMVIVAIGSIALFARVSNRVFDARMVELLERRP